MEFLQNDQLKIEIHELCHVQQAYLGTSNSAISAMNSDPAYPILGFGWEHTEAHQKFVTITNFTITLELDHWIVELPENSVFKEIYSINQNELSAELCSLYLLNEMGEKFARYDAGPVRYLEDFDEVGYRIQPLDFDVSRYLTPEIVEWLETYMILPRANAPAGAGR